MDRELLASARLSFIDFLTLEFPGTPLRHRGVAEGSLPGIHADFRRIRRDAAPFSPVRLPPPIARPWRCSGSARRRSDWPQITSRRGQSFFSGRVTFVGR